MRKYKNNLKSNNPVQNAMALTILLEKGRENILNENYFKEMLKGIENKPNALMSVEYQKEMLNIAKNMAQMENKDLYEFIHDKVKDDRKQEKGR